MEEKRLYFRLKNKGEMRATIATRPLDVLEISSNGVLVIKKNISLPERGSINIKINNFSITVAYETLRIDDKSMALIFIDENEINSLFVFLKHLRDERKQKSQNKSE